MPIAKCELCDITSPLPACCAPLLIEEDRLTCPKCHKTFQVPKCCGNQMLIFKV